MLLSLRLKLGAKLRPEPDLRPVRLLRLACGFHVPKIGRTAGSAGRRPRPISNERGNPAIAIRQSDEIRFRKSNDPRHIPGRGGLCCTVFVMDAFTSVKAAIDKELSIYVDFK